MSFTKESPRRKMEHLEKKQRLVFSGQFLSLCLLFEHDSYHCDAVNETKSRPSGQI
jgi:hypothetical protein